MSNHDPLCMKPKYGLRCECTMIAKVRADERERIAQAIEAKRDDRRDTWGSEDEHEEGMAFAFRIAARIARGGSDE